MENWYQYLFIVLCLGLLSLPSAADQSDTVPLIEPDVKPEPLGPVAIDEEDLELGIYGGVINIEDFESSPLVGVRAALHIDETLFLEAHYAFAEAGETSAENFGINLLSDRDYSHYFLSLGVNLLQGQGLFASFLSEKNFAYTSNFYFSAGLGATDFAGDQEQTVNFGWGYQVLINDWISWHIVTRAHVFENELLGKEKRNLNTELSSGISLFF